MRAQIPNTRISPMRNTRSNTWLCLFIAVLTWPSVAFAQADLNAAVERAFETGVALGIPGISVAIGVGDEVVWAGTTGFDDVVGRVGLENDALFGVGSITKTFVARVILQLAEEGLVDLDDTATDYVDRDVVRAVPNATRATLRQLINHQSGVPTWEFEPSWIRAGRGAEMTLGHVWGKTETLEYNTAELTPPSHDPGVRYAYSNTNYTLLGLVIEAVTGNDASAEIRTRILEPLGLGDTYLESFEEIPGGYTRHYHYATKEFQEVAGVHRGFTEVRPGLVESTAGNLSPEEWSPQPQTLSVGRWRCGTENSSTPMP